MNHAYAEFLKLVRKAAHRHDTYTVFRDFCEMFACDLSNGIDPRFYDVREAAYMECVKRHHDNRFLFQDMAGALTYAYDVDPVDHLGRAFHELEIQNKWIGQFFTPYELCRLMARLNLGTDTQEIVERNGFIRANEPACGSGGMMMALCEALQEQGINYQQHLHVVAQDLDIRCVHMTYIQLTMLHCPAIVIHGDTLALEERSHWYTCAHIIGFWDHRLRRARAQDPVPTPVPEAEPERVLEPALLFEAPVHKAQSTRATKQPAAKPVTGGAQFTLF